MQISLSKENLVKPMSPVKMVDEWSMRNTGELGKDAQLKNDLLHVAIVDIYLSLKKQINKYNKKDIQGLSEE